MMPSKINFKIACEMPSYEEKLFLYTMPLFVQLCFMNMDDVTKLEPSMLDLLEDLRNSKRD